MKFLFSLYSFGITATWVILVYEDWDLCVGMKSCGLMVAENWLRSLIWPWVWFETFLPPLPF